MGTQREGEKLEESSSVKCPAWANLQRQRADQCLPKARGPGAGGRGRDCWWVQGFFWADENVLKLMVVTAARLCECSPNR